MENKTYLNCFYLEWFSNDKGNSLLLFIIFYFLYFIGVLWNLVIITAVCMDFHLHTPMYIFLGNLSFVDICYTTVNLPKLMDILLSGNNSIPYTQCFIQLYFFILLGCTEIILLSIMAYDRYVAICRPLHYNIIMKCKMCALFLGGTWVSASANAFLLTGSVANLHYCHSKRIQHFYCEPRAMTKLFCPDIGFYIILYIESFFFGFFPFLLSLISYYKIINSILHIVSSDGRKKAFSTCTSHLIVLTLFYGSIVCVYIKPLSEHTDTIEQFFSVLYAAVTPMLNPLIYSLRNKEVRGALMKIVCNKCPQII